MADVDDVKSVNDRFGDATVSIGVSVPDHADRRRATPGAPFSISKTNGTLHARQVGDEPERLKHSAQMSMGL